MKDIIINCKECGARIPPELIKKLMNNESIYCERCGIENLPIDFNLQDLKEHLKSKTLNNYKEILKTSGNRFFTMMKSKINEIKEDIELKLKKID
ncbi:MAG: hypothetical protein ACTSU4_15035 [Promethearchaeota archaeon]